MLLPELPYRRKIDEIHISPVVEKQPKKNSEIRLERCHKGMNSKRKQDVIKEDLHENRRTINNKALMLRQLILDC